MDRVLTDILMEWQRRRESPIPVTVEEVCAGRPDLLPEVRRLAGRLAACDRLLADAGLDAAPKAVGRFEIRGYEILGVLGRGGMGVVYQAQQVRLKRLVALKMIRAGGQADEAELARFRLEAEAVARLQHPNIVQIYDVGDHAGQPFLALEFVPGGTLATRLAATPQPPREAATLVRTLARAVDVANRAGIVHRDLKPANILLADDGSTTVTDVGLAKRLDDDTGQTRTGAVMGTPAYMAPEQALGQVKEIGPAADVYALGVILYEALTGSVPFKGRPSWRPWSRCGRGTQWPSGCTSRKSLATSKQSA